MENRLALVVTLIMVGAAAVAASASARAGELDSLLELKDFTAHRVSSADPSGGNLDMRRVNAGKTLTLAELEGPGVITHIWFTVS